MILEYHLSQIYLGDKVRQFVGQVPPNRDFQVEQHLPLWEGPNTVDCHASRRCLQLGKVMYTRCPGPVGGDNLVCPSCLRAVFPVWDHLCFAMMVTVGCHEVISAAPMT